MYTFPHTKNAISQFFQPVLSSPPCFTIQGIRGGTGSGMEEEDGQKSLCLILNVYKFIAFSYNSVIR